MPQLPRFGAVAGGAEPGPEGLAPSGAVAGSTISLGSSVAARLQPPQVGCVGLQAMQSRNQGWESGLGIRAGNQGQELGLGIRAGNQGQAPKPEEEYLLGVLTDNHILDPTPTNAT